MMERLSPASLMKILLGLCAFLSLVTGVPYAIVWLRSGGGALAQTVSTEEARTHAESGGSAAITERGIGVSTAQAAILFCVTIAIVLCAGFAYRFIPMLIQQGREEAESESRTHIRKWKEKVQEYEKANDSLRESDRRANDAIHLMQIEKERLDESIKSLREKNQKLESQVARSAQPQKAFEEAQSRWVVDKQKLDEEKHRLESDIQSLDESKSLLKRKVEQLNRRQSEIHAANESLKIAGEQLRNGNSQLQREKHELDHHIFEQRSKLDAYEEFKRSKTELEACYSNQEKELSRVRGELEIRNSELQQVLLNKAKAWQELEIAKADAENTRRMAEEDLQNAKSRLAYASDKEHALHKQEVQLSEQKLRQNADAENLSQKAQEIEKERLAVKLMREQVQAAQEAAVATLALNDTRLREISHFRSNNWPSWYIGGALSPKIDELEQWARTGNSYAKLILSNLQVLNAIESHVDLSKDFNYIRPAVRDLGKFLAQALVVQGYSADDSSRILVEWAKSVNQSFAGRCRLSVPALGSAFDPLEMQPVGGPVKTVSKIHNWSIINARAITEIKAEVS